jgi:peptidoglycan hydrolase-like protein with peptidoglycan-binding domain
MNKRPSMEVLARHSPRPRRRWPWIVGIGVAVILALAALGIGITIGRAHATRQPAASAVSQAPPEPLTVVSTSPAMGAQQVASGSQVMVRFSAPLEDTPSSGGAVPTFTPPIAGAWQRLDRFTLQFDPSAPFIPSTTESLTVPGGPEGVRAADGRVLGADVTVSFTIAAGSEERLQQLLALTGYLPLTFTPTGAAPAPAQMALDQTGAFSWRWPALPASLTSLWVEGVPSAITKAAVMTVENQNGLAVDAIAGPKVWAILLQDAAKGFTSGSPYTYVYVSKVLPENLTLWVDGVPKFQNIAVNTGVPGADTADGTYEVFEHVTASEMKGTNPDGTTYDDPNVPWASYFNGGDALHGFVRATYGSPQSNGCVEMAITDAAATWPYTPIGTLVTVDGPAAT